MGVRGGADTAAVRCSHSWQADCLLGSKTVGQQADPGADHGADPGADVSWHAALEWLERCRYLGQQLINHLVCCSMLGCNTVGRQADYRACHAIVSAGTLLWAGWKGAASPASRSSTT